jgi:hypothetical protein
MKDFLRAVLINMDASDEARRLSGVRALSDFTASSAMALELVVRDSQVMEAWVSLLSGKPDVQAAAMHSIANVIASPSLNGSFASDSASAPPPPPPPNSSASASASSSLVPSMSEDVKVTELKKNLCNSIGRNKKMTTGAFLLKAVRTPIEGLRAGALDLMRAMAVQPTGWGVHDLYNTPGFREFLEDPESEFTKEGKEWKFSVVQALALKKEFIGDSNKTILETILKRGPFYKPMRSGDVQVLEK